MNATETQPGSSLDPLGSAIEIRHVFSGAITIRVTDCTQRIWLDRAEAVQLLEMLPEAINRMPVSIMPNAETQQRRENP